MPRPFSQQDELVQRNMYAPSDWMRTVELTIRGYPLAGTYHDEPTTAEEEEGKHLAAESGVIYNVTVRIGVCVSPAPHQYSHCLNLCGKI